VGAKVVVFWKAGKLSMKDERRMNFPIAIGACFAQVRLLSSFAMLVFSVFL